MQGFPLQAKLCTTRPIERAERSGPVAHSELGGGNRGEIYGVAFFQAGVRQTQAAVAQWEGELVCRGPAMQAYTMMAKVQSTPLLSPRTTTGPTCSHVQPPGTCAARFWRLL
jgi:hypothetical protein